MLDEAAPDQVVECGGLLGGLTAYHMRVLCESSWEGGGGYTPEQVGRMTLDQAWFRLCDVNVLKNAEERWKAKKPEAALEGTGKLVRLEDGTLKRLPVSEKSYAQQIREQSQPKREGRRAKRRRRTAEE